MKKAVLFLIFNRLETTSEVFNAIRKAKPPRLYVASDGPRLEKEGEVETVNETRDLVLNNIDWDCEVKTLLRESNLGCGRAVSEAITWFFENEPEGIILEDDCLPSQSFFKFCEELLDYYRDNKRVMHISGESKDFKINSRDSYYFAQIEHCWGWATWADRWKKFNFKIQYHEKLNYEKVFKNKEAREYWWNIFSKMDSNQNHVWDYQWTYAILKEEGLCVNSSKNLISNIGFTGTHYTDADDDVNLNRPIFETGEIIHPKEIKLNERAVNHIYKQVFGIKKRSIVNKIIRKIISKVINKIRLIFNFK